MDEEKNEILSEQPEENKISAAAPRGILAFGIVSCLIFGLIGLMLLFVLAVMRPEDVTRARAIFTETGIPPNITDAELFTALRAGVTAAIALFAPLAAGSVGVILKKEWGRRVTLFGAFVFVVWMCVSAMGNPLAAGRAAALIVYPGILIFYLTSKNVVKFFN